MKKITVFFFLLLNVLLHAQVGVNTTTPDPSSMLDIAATNKGVLVPRVSLTNVTTTMLDGTNTAATGLLIWNTNAATVGGNGVGFYFFNGTQWIPITQTITGNTLDQSYDQGGAGVGKNIEATDGAVRINGDDGFLVTGTYGSGNTIDTEITGTGTRMFFNPRNAAFRAGYAENNRWDDVNMGEYSFAVNRNSEASGFGSVSLGYGSAAIGDYSVAMGRLNQANGESSSSIGNSCFAFGDRSFASGNFTNASGNNSTTFGDRTHTDGWASTAFGKNNTSSSYGEMVIGIGATTYTPSSNGLNQFRATNATDRLFVIGNAIDSNNNDNVENFERSDALIVLKNGLTRLPSQNISMIDDADGKTIVTKEYLLSRSSGTLEQAYNHPLPGQGRTIPANNGAVRIVGVDGFYSTGIIDSGALIANQLGPQLHWYPRKAAFRAGQLSGTQTPWTDSNIGYHSVAFGQNTIASGLNSSAFGAFTNASESYSTAFGAFTNATAFYSTAFGNNSTASGNTSIVFGINNQAPSMGETVLGIGATNYTPSLYGSWQFRTANENDRLLVVGNAIDLNEDGEVNDAERRDALVILKNGNTGIGSSTPQDRLHVVGNIRMVDGNQASGKVLKSDTNGTASWQDDNDNQTLILSGTDLSISGGNSVNLNSLVQTDNGISSVSNHLGLGGTLNRATQLDLSTFGINFNIDSTGPFKVQNNGNETFNVLQDGSSFFANRLAVGKTFASYMLDVEQTSATSTRAISSIKTDNTTSATNNIYASKTTNGNGVSTGIFNTSTGTGTGAKRGINNIINSTGNADQILILNELLSTNTTGMYYGVRNLISGTSGSAAIGSDQQLTGNSLGAKTGINNNITGASNTQAYRGNQSTISGTGDGARIGTDNSISTAGNGIHYGSRNQLSGNGNGFKYGTYNLLDAEGGIQYGTYNEISGNGTTQYGTYNVLNGTGIKYGTYNSVDVNQGWAGYFVGKGTFTNRLSIGSDDNPNAALHINKSSTITYAHLELTQSGLVTTAGSRIRFNSSAETDNEWILFARTNNDATTSRINFFHTGTGDVLRIFGSGRVGIMRNPATNALEVAGEASKTTAGGWIANSDSRLKKDISTISPNEALEKILKLRGVTYYWNDDKTGTTRPENLQIGFIAQEIAEVFPEKVTEDNLGYLQTAYGDYDPIVFQAIKALNDKIEKLENENSALKSALEKVNALEAKLEQMNIK